MLNIGIIGAGGRMGRHCIAAIAAEPGAKLAAALETPESPLLGQDAASVAGLPACGVCITSDAEAAFAAADVMVDFSFCDVFPAMLRCALHAKKPLVVGTTGLGPGDMQAINQASRDIPVFQSNNYSIGIAVLRELVRTAAQKLGKGFDIEITETHHRHKKDAPSGTALTLAEAAAAGRGYDPADAFCYGRSGMAVGRPEREIAIHALRGGEVVGEHTVYFFGGAERLVLGHSADSRMNFALGAIRAARWLAKQPPGRYGIENLLAPDA